MTEECTHDCENCSAKCGQSEEIPKLEPNAFSNIAHSVAVVSGKGGVGKSLVTSLLAVETSRRGLRTAIADMDVTGPSIPKMFGVTQKAGWNEDGILPAVTTTGIEIMSINLLLENETDPVVWRGPVIAGTVRQFWTDVVWNDVDMMFFDMPPGTGDVPLTVYQQIPLDGIIIVTSPQELVSMIVEKAAKMAELLNVPILGIVENMSYAVCPDCGKHIEVFGKSSAAEVADKFGIPLLARIPLNPKLAAAADAGAIELNDDTSITPAADLISRLAEK